MANPIEVADRITHLVADALTPLERTIQKWPAEFREIIWLAVEATAKSNASEAEKLKNG